MLHTLFALNNIAHIYQKYLRKIISKTYINLLAMEIRACMSLAILHMCWFSGQLIFSALLACDRADRVTFGGVK